MHGSLKGQFTQIKRKHIFALTAGVAGGVQPQRQYWVLFTQVQRYPFVRLLTPPRYNGSEWLKVLTTAFW